MFAELADSPDEAGSIAQVRSMLWERLRITPGEITRRFRLAARIRPRRSLTGPPLPAELSALAAAVQAGTVGDDHIRSVCRAIDVLPACISPADVQAAERTLVKQATRVDAGIVAKLGQRIADYLNPDGLFSDEDRARRRGLRLGEQGPDGPARDQPRPPSRRTPFAATQTRPKKPPTGATNRAADSRQPPS
jgi:hypothetical protein